MVVFADIVVKQVVTTGDFLYDGHLKSIHIAVNIRWRMLS